jgi:hypothetical protein
MRPDSCDISHPFFLGPLRLKVSLQDMRSNWMRVVAIGGPGLVTLSHRDEAVLTHQADNTLATTAQTLVLQDGVDARAAIDATTILKNLLTQASVFLPMS